MSYLAVKKISFISLTSLFLLGSISGCDRNTRTNVLSKNVSQDCVSNYDRDVDYFPKKVKLNYAKGFTVEYRKHYKIVTVKNPWKNADRSFQYILVKCGTPIPKGYDKAEIVRVPVRTMVAMSTTYLPYLPDLDLVDNLVGVSSFKNVNTPEVKKKITEGNLKQLGSNSEINIEQILELNPDLIMTFGTGNLELDRHSQLLEAGLFVAINSEYMENEPLGRTEWLKFIAVFFDREDRAEKLFSKIASKYEKIAALTENIANKPTVFTGFSYKGTWYVPGGKSYLAAYLEDAGADYIWSEIDSRGSLPKDFESVFNKGNDAEYWLNGSRNWQNLQDILNTDDRYQNFNAFKNGKVYNNNARLNETGGNDYWESGIANPDLVLADLIKIFHPELLPEHELVYYQQLE
ncbi:MAG: ABC transporter substrate-binding protein [Prochloraceae cyanobacterium]|nr:ABC transporter substrate-binding protein [Prochloraceae cyanobacterium]